METLTRRVAEQVQLGLIKNSGSVGFIESFIMDLASKVDKGAKYPLSDKQAKCLQDALTKYEGGAVQEVADHFAKLEGGEPHIKQDNVSQAFDDTRFSEEQWVEIEKEFNKLKVDDAGKFYLSILDTIVKRKSSNASEKQAQVLYREFSSIKRKPLWPSYPALNSLVYEVVTGHLSILDAMSEKKNYGGYNKQTYNKHF